MVFLVLCFLTITFFSQGWGGKHYLVKTKDKGKYEPGPEAGHDYNDYVEDEDVEVDDGNAIDDGYDDDTHDDDTYDDDDNEEVDVTALIDDKIGEDAKEELANMSAEEQDEALEMIKEAASNKGDEMHEDYSANLRALRGILRHAQGFLKAVLMMLQNITKESLNGYRLTSCESKCINQCTGYSSHRTFRSRRSSRRRKGSKGKKHQRKKGNYYWAKKTKHRRCQSKCENQCYSEWKN